MNNEGSAETPFQSYAEAISYMNNCNPARAKYRSRIEPESNSVKVEHDFTGKSQKDIWASVRLAVELVLISYDETRAEAWKLRNMGDRDGQLAVVDIAERMGKSKMTVHRWLNRIDDDMQREFTRRWLIPREDQE